MKVCVECCNPVTDVYKEFSKGNIRLTKCSYCHKICDKYVEYELMLIFLDLILHRPQAYRHALYNYFPSKSNSLLKIFPFLMFFDAYLRWFRLVHHYSAFRFIEFLSTLAVKPEDRHFTILAIAIGEYLFFIIGIIIIYFLFLHFQKHTKRGYLIGIELPSIYLVNTVLLASFGKLFIIFTVIWEYEKDFGRIIEIFVFTSTVTGLKAVFKTSTPISAAMIFGGIILKSFFLFTFRSFWDETMIISVL